MSIKYINNAHFNANVYKDDTFRNIVTSYSDPTHHENVNIANALGTMARWYDEISYMRYIMQGIMVARVLDLENISETLLIGDFNRLNCYKNRRRCTVLPDGTITAFYGDSNYDESTPGVDVMVYQPKFYYKVEPITIEPISGGSGYHIRKAIYYVSDAPIGGFKLHPAFINHTGREVDCFLIGAYEGCLMRDSTYNTTDAATGTSPTDKFASRAGVKPTSGVNKSLTHAFIITCCNNKGPGWYEMGIKQYAANQLLAMIEYGPDLQTAIGSGIVNITGAESINCSSYTGSTASLGNSTGSATSTVNEVNGTETTYSEDGKVAISYRGMENPYGNMLEQVAGITISNSSGIDQAYIASDFNYSSGKYTDNYKPVGFKLADTDGFITAFGYSSETYDWLFLPSETNASINASLIKDAISTNSTVDTARLMLIGGSWGNGTNAGIFYSYLRFAYTTYARSICGRICYYPDTEITIDTFSDEEPDGEGLI